MLVYPLLLCAKLTFLLQGKVDLLTAEFDEA